MHARVSSVRVYIRAEFDFQKSPFLLLYLYIYIYTYTSRVAQRRRRYDRNRYITRERLRNGREYPKKRERVNERENERNNIIYIYIYYRTPPRLDITRERVSGAAGCVCCFVRREIDPMAEGVVCVCV